MGWIGENFMYENVSIAFVFTLIAGLSTTIGASIAYFLKRPNFSFLSFLLGFSAGVMIYISFVELLRTSIDEIGFLFANIGFFAGIGGIYLVDTFLPHAHLDAKLDSFHRTDEKHVKLMEAGILTAVGIAIHNFPEGMAVFAVSLESLRIGLGVAIAIAIHNIPEGIAVSVPIFYATGDRKKSFLYSFLSGIAEPLGAGIGFLVLLPFLSKVSLNITLAVVAGIMVFISFDELLPISREYGDEHLSTFGLFLGMVIMTLSLVFL